MDKETRDRKIRTVVSKHYPVVQAVYLFGFLATGEERPEENQKKQLDKQRCG
ncbi:hypothetical protein H206_03136 [Candidatus Electrothrix aarhusensis]|uniref:Uncharacterized protein n=1 Tax=Candidatus Electrothrix aarhusensis TaxID=1859131 RepID=A0A444IT12_9BACT|nr:hypothetical protein H206_03136 [Candidatus Electrothrix aarhusensis]